eukprot:TRINITY_DN43905_c0_g1_i1.p1 TRINITY_DN43905_c0_g1~~TRINITY_DN43905_c0_g1_i1.p1  ORF type:complete len:129 (+),score=25.12 TRINITY_DN43905_c0_g1_i1:46-387(+)
MLRSLVGSEMCIRDSTHGASHHQSVHQQLLLLLRYTSMLTAVILLLFIFQLHYLKNVLRIYNCIVRIIINVAKSSGAVDCCLKRSGYRIMVVVLILIKIADQHHYTRLAGCRC